MALQAIEAAPKDENPVFLVDLDTSEMTTAHWAVRHGVSSQSEGASIASIHRPPASKTFEGSRRSSRVVARASVAAGVCVLWLFIDAAGDHGLCAESHIRAKAFVAPIKMERKIAQPDTMRGKSSLVSRAVETTFVVQKQIFESGREKSDILADRLTPVPPAELDASRSAAEAARTRHEQALDQERDRAHALARELASLRAELDAARVIDSEEAVQAAAAEIKQMRALDQERDRADALARELTFLRAELDAARIEGPEVTQAAVTEVEPKRALKQDGDRAEALARALTSLRAELETLRTASLEAVRTAEAATIEQTQAFVKERDRAETLASELASARKDAEECSARLAAAHAEVLQVTETKRAIAAEQKLALASERNRADALARELTSVSGELEARNRRIAALRMERSTSASAASRSPANKLRLRARANASLRHADIGSARPLLGHAIERGSARAAFMQARTNDARVLQSRRAAQLPVILRRSASSINGRRQAALRM
jgi:hypothetical protein